MNRKEIENWLISLKSDILKFISRINENNFYHYSLSGDIYPLTTKWGLGNAVFASKIYYMLNELTPERKQVLSNFIKSFQNKQGYINDPLVLRLSSVKRIYLALRNLYFKNLFGKATMRAETRQAFAALSCLNNRPDLPFLHIPYTESEIEKFINTLNWKQPWSACSHVSHLLFFLKINKTFFNIHYQSAEDLIQFVIKYVNLKYRQKDGSWYDSLSALPHYEKVNAAMKMMTGYDAVKWREIGQEHKLIDLCLSAINEGHACNHFNVICVLYHCCKETDYKINEIHQYCLQQLEHYRQYYWPETGGFSFFKGKASHSYYNAILSKGLREPDIHGTVLFLWGIVLVTKILKYDHIIELQPPIT